MRRALTKTPTAPTATTIVEEKDPQNGGFMHDPCSHDVVDDESFAGEPDAGTDRTKHR